MNGIIDGLCSKYKLEDVKDIVAFYLKKYNIGSSSGGTDIEKDTTLKNAVLVNEDYILKLYQNTDSLKGVLSDRDYNSFFEKLKKIIEADDYDDPEDVMSEIHNAIEKYIYGSFVKIAPEKVKVLEDYILNADYKKIDSIKTINGNARYFETMFSEIVSNSNLDGMIKKIDKEPYSITYLNDESEEELTLKGTCVYYKNEA